MILFISGLVIGSVVTLFVMSLCAMSKNDDDCECTQKGWRRYDCDNCGKEEE